MISINPDSRAAASTPPAEPDFFPVQVVRKECVAQDIYLFELRLPDGAAARELPAFSAGGPMGSLSILLIVAVAVIKIAAVGFVIVIIGGRVVPAVLKHVAATHSRELFTLAILVVAIGIAIGSARFFGVSMALGAFLAGIVVGQSDFSLRAATDALPMRDAFAVLFFVSIGMLFDPGVLYESPGLVLWTLAIIMVATPAAAVTILLVLGYPIPMAMKIALSLAQIGEFSFILTNLGIQLNLLPALCIHVLVAVSIVSIALSPVMQFFAEPLARRICRTGWGETLATMRKPFTWNKAAENTTGMDAVETEYRAVIVGFGPIGQTVSRLLQENGIVPTIVELNHESLASIRQCGYAAVLGDASIPETLSHAGIQKSVSLILSASTIRNTPEIIRFARFLNPQIKVIVRSNYLRERNSLLQSGADNVFAGEGEVALAMAEFILRDLGATPDQIDREREKMRSDLFA